MDTQKIFRITVDYQTANANLEEVKRKIKELHEAERELVRQQQELERRFRAGEVSQAEHTAQMKANREAMVQNRQALTALTDEKRRATLETNKLAVSEKAGEGSMVQMQSRLIALRSQYRQLTEAQRMNAAVGGKMRREIEQLADRYRKLEMSIGNTSANVGNYASVLNKAQGTFALITAGLYGIQKAFQPFIDFEYQMDKVRAVSGATAEEFGRLTDDAKRLGEATEYTASEVAELQLNYARLGFSPDEIIAVTQATLDLATATGEDLAQSADVAGATLRGFRLDASQMPRVVDVMANSFNLTALSLDNFTDSMKYVAPIAASAGVSLEQTTAMLGVLADAGIRGSQAGTSLRRILTEMSVSGKSVSEALLDLERKGITVAGAMDEVGKYAMTALNVLANGAGQVDSLTVALDESAHAAESAAAVMRDNLQGDIDKLMSKLEGVAIWFGDVFSPVLRLLAQGFTALLEPIKVAVVALGSWFAVLKTGTGVVTLFSAAKKTFRKGVADSTQALIIETAAMDANTDAAQSNLAKIRAMPATVKAWAAAKLLLAGNFRAAAVAAKAFFASIGPVGWFAVGIGAVVGALTAFSSGAEEAADAGARLALELSQEKATYEDLKRAVAESTEGSKARAEAIRLINERYKDYLPNMLTEKMSNEEIAAALDYVNRKMEENIKARIRAEEMQRIQQERFDTEKKVLEDLVKAYENTGDRTETEVGIATAAFGDLIQAYKKSGDYAQFAAGVAKICGKELFNLGRAAKDGSVEMTGRWGIVVVEFSDLQEAARKAAREIEKLNAVAGHVSGGADPYDAMTLEQLNAALSTVNSKLALKNALTDEQRIAAQAERKGIQEQIALRRQQIETDNTYAGVLQRLKDEKAALEQQLDTADVSDTTEIERIRALISAKQAEIDAFEGKNRKHLDKLQKQEENAFEKRAEFLSKQARKLEDIESQIADMQVAAYEDGLNKKLIQSERAGQKELVQQRRANADLLAETDKHIEALTDKGEKRTEEEERQLEELNAQREQLVAAGGRIELAIIAKNALAREKIMREANEKELNEYIDFQMKIGNYVLANEAYHILRIKEQEAHKSRLNKAKENYGEEMQFVELQHAIELESIAKHLLTKRQIEEREAKENFRYEQDKFNVTKKNQEAIFTAEAELLKKQLDNGKITEEEYKKRIKQLTSSIAQEIAEANTKLQGAEQQARRTTWLGKMLGLDDESVEQLKQQAFQVASEIANTLTQIGMQNSQHQLKVETERIEATKDKELAALDERKRKGVLSEKQYEKQKEAIEKKAEARKEQAEREAFEREKRLKIAQVWTDVAMGIAKIWAEWGTTPFKLPWAIAQTAFLTITGGAQTAMIASQKYSRGGVVEMYSDGPAASFGMIRGRSHAAGGNRLSIDGRPIAEVEGNETLVILRRGSEQFMPLLSELNASVGGRKFAQGGVVRSPSLRIPAAAPVPRSLFAPTASVETQLAGFRDDMRATIQRLDANIQAVNTRVDNIRVHVLETEITDTQNRVRAMVQQATY